jgi:bifunctional non-homologous end joining protein LigD
LSKPPTIGVKAPFRFIEPALATSIEKVPSGERWIHEIRFDGYQGAADLVNDGIKVLTRRGSDWARGLKKIAGCVFDQCRICPHPR